MTAAECSSSSRPPAKAWEESVSAQAAKESLIAAALSAEEKKQLNALLRRLMVEFERRGVKKR